MPPAFGADRPDIASIFADQALECRKLGSPFTGQILDQVLDLVAPGTPLGRRIFHADVRAEDAFPLRLAGALHALARAGDRDLAPVYPPHAAPGDALAAALRNTLTRRATDILPWLDQPPQTNEVARSAVLIAAGHWLTARFGLPLVHSELGASAGVNLWWDHYGLRAGGRTLGPAAPALTLTPDWQGDPPPLAQPVVIDRAGVDLIPLDPVRDRDRLLAYIWADQAARAARCGAALDLTAQKGLRVIRGDAADFAAARLTSDPEGALHLICHTVAAKYFSQDTTRRLGEALTKAGAEATPTRPLAHLSMEHDGPTPGAALALTLWPGGQTLPLGRADFHGRWVDWRAPPP